MRNNSRSTVYSHNYDRIDSVENINKYYVAYKLSGDLLEHRDDERSVLKEG